MGHCAHVAPQILDGMFAVSGQVNQVSVRPRPAFNDIAAPKSPQLNVYLRQIGVSDRPRTGLGVLEHHVRVYVADGGGEGIEVRERLGLHVATNSRKKTYRYRKSVCSAAHFP